MDLGGERSPATPEAQVAGARHARGLFAALFSNRATATTPKNSPSLSGCDLVAALRDLVVVDPMSAGVQEAVVDHFVATAPRRVPAALWREPAAGRPPARHRVPAAFGTLRPRHRDSRPSRQLAGVSRLFLPLICLFLQSAILLQSGWILLRGGGATVAFQFDLVLSHL
jgi:hypothetical protein